MTRKAREDARKYILLWIKLACTQVEPGNYIFSLTYGVLPPIQYIAGKQYFEISSLRRAITHRQGLAIL